MPNDFQQTVNLREKMKKAKLTSQNKRSEQLEHVYNNENGGDVQEDLQKINQPKVRRVNEKLTKLIVIILAIILIGVVAYWLFFSGQPEDAGNTSQEQNWYTIKLVNGEVYYGQISDLSADPVVVSNVYYNYDQVKDDGEEVDETSNIRLVKRGKETHGPSGEMNIVRSQVLYMEPLGDGSKVLQAILEYEK